VGTITKKEYDRAVVRRRGRAGEEDPSIISDDAFVNSKLADPPDNGGASFSGVRPTASSDRSLRSGTATRFVAALARQFAGGPFIERQVLVRSLADPALPPKPGFTVGFDEESKSYRVFVEGEDDPVMIPEHLIQVDEAVNAGEVPFDEQAAVGSRRKSRKKKKRKVGDAIPPPASPPASPVPAPAPPVPYVRKFARENEDYAIVKFKGFGLNASATYDMNDIDDQEVHLQGGKRGVIEQYHLDQEDPERMAFLNAQFALARARDYFPDEST
jgi:hypothetical protein